MGKSFRKTKIFGIAGGRKSSEAWDKRQCNKKIRHKVKERLEAEDYDTPMPLPNEVHNEWGMAKDGKHWWSDATKRDMGK